MVYTADAPLCPAGHLPHKGGDHKLHDLYPAISRQLFTVAGWLLRGAERCTQPISPLVGEMPGRAEGGNSFHQVRVSAHIAGTAPTGQPQ
jgi:hypothetical protein